MQNSTMAQVQGASLPAFTVNPYSSKPHIIYLLELQAQKVRKNNLIYGLGLSYEMLISKVKIDTIVQSSYAYNVFSATGETRLRNSYINLNPYIGRRFLMGQINLDITAGADMAFCIKSHDKGIAGTTNGNGVRTDYNIPKPTLDFRPRLQASLYYKRFGVLAGYSLGLTSYKSVESEKAYTSIFRLGVSYKFL